jgi:hypothetical protein
LPLRYLLIAPLVSSDCPFGIFWFPLWYLIISHLKWLNMKMTRHKTLAYQYGLCSVG